MINIIRDKKDVTKAQLWEAYRDMVEHYEDALSIISDAKIPAPTQRAKCPDCGIPTVPDHQGLSYDDKRCDGCLAQYETR